MTKYSEKQKLEAVEAYEKGITSTPARPPATRRRSTAKARTGARRNSAGRASCKARHHGCRAFVRRDLFTQEIAAKRRPMMTGASP